MCKLETRLKGRFSDACGCSRYPWMLYCFCCVYIGWKGRHGHHIARACADGGLYRPHHPCVDHARAKSSQPTSRSPLLHSTHRRAALSHPLTAARPQPHNPASSVEPSSLISKVSAHAPTNYFCTTTRGINSDSDSETVSAKPMPSTESTPSISNS
jgi:hypothetical protein